MLKRISVALLAGCLLSAAAWAELGPINVQSRQGEPFRAEVTVTDAATLDTGSVHTGLASRALFDQLNVNFQPELRWLTFSLVSGADGPVVRIRSRRPIMTPNLRFVLQISGPGGSWVRPYAVKLESKTPSAASAPTGKAAAAPVRTLQVTPGSTTVSLGRQIRIAGVSLERAMAALYLANRDNFIGADPLRPRVGATLQVPSDAAQRAMSAARARAIFHPAPASANTAVMPPAGKPAVHAAGKPAQAHAVSKVPPRAETRREKPMAEKAVTEKPAAETSVQASAAAAMAASDAAASRQIQKLTQQVDSKAQDLNRANKNIVDLKQRIHALEASQAAAAKAMSAGFGSRVPVWALAGGGGGLVVLLGLFFWWRRRRGGGEKKKAKPAPVKPLSSTGVMQPDPASAEAAGKGDALAEAEVYLAYGHDDQAENILRAALAQHPGRQDIRAKLLEIYAARPDPLRFAELAHDVHDAYDGRGAMWERTRAMGLAIDPDNPLYQPESLPDAGQVPDLSMTESLAADDANAEDAMAGLEDMMSPEAATAAVPEAKNNNGNDLLDFDFAIDAQSMPTATPAPDVPVIEAPPLMDVELPPAAGTEPDWPIESQTDAQGVADTMAPAGADSVEAAPVEAAPVEAIVQKPSDGEEALATKLDLARVYLDMGDNDGAREVLQELQREARGALRKQADEMLARIN